MLGFQYVVTKSRELSSVLDRELTAASNYSSPFGYLSSTSSCENPTSNETDVATEASTTSSLSVRNEGHLFFRAQHKLHAQTVSNHLKLTHSGQELHTALSHARATLQDQAASEQILAQNFHLVSSVRQQLAGVRRLVLKLAKEAGEVENLLLQRCEEKVAQQNAEFAAKQQQELENFEASIAKESEDRKRELLEMRRRKLASAFMKDVKTYQTLVSDYGDEATMESELVKEEKENVTLDEVDLIVTADLEQLDAFYDSLSEQEEEECNIPKVSMLSVPKELSGEEEEKREVKGIELGMEKPGDREKMHENVGTLVDQ